MSEGEWGEKETDEGKNERHLSLEDAQTDEERLVWLCAETAGCGCQLIGDEHIGRGGRQESAHVIYVMSEFCILPEEIGFGGREGGMRRVRVHGEKTDLGFTASFVSDSTIVSS